MFGSRLGDLVNGRLFRRELGVIRIGWNNHLTDEFISVEYFAGIYITKLLEYLIMGGLSVDSFCGILIDNYFGK